MSFLWQKFWDDGERFVYEGAPEGPKGPEVQAETAGEGEAETIDEVQEQLDNQRENLEAEIRKTIDSLNALGTANAVVSDAVGFLENVQDRMTTKLDGAEAKDRQQEVLDHYEGILEKAVGRVNEAILTDLGLEVEDKINQISEELESGEFPPEVTTEVTQLLDYIRTSLDRATTFSNYLQIFNDLNLAQMQMAPPPEPGPAMVERDAYTEEYPAEEAAPAKSSGGSTKKAPAEEAPAEELSEETTEEEEGKPEESSEVSEENDYPPHVVEQHRSAQELLTQLSAGSESPSSSYNGGDVMRPGRLDALSITDHSNYVIGMSLEQPETSDYANLVLDYSGATFTQDFADSAGFAKNYPKLFSKLPAAGASATLEEPMTLPSEKPEPFGGATRTRSLEVSVDENGAINVVVKNIKFNGDSRLSIPLKKPLSELKENGTTDDILYPDGYAPNDPKEIARLGRGEGSGAVLDSAPEEGASETPEEPNKQGNTPEETQEQVEAPKDEFSPLKKGGVEYNADQTTDTFTDTFGESAAALEAAGITMNGITIRPVRPFKKHAIRLRFDGSFDSHGEARKLKANILIAKGENWEESVGKAIDRVVKKKDRKEKRIDANRERQAEINDENWDGPAEPMDARYEHSGGEGPLAIPVGEEHLAKGTTAEATEENKGTIWTLDEHMDAWGTKGPRGEQPEEPAEESPVEVNKDTGPDLGKGMDNPA